MEAILGHEDPTDKRWFCEDCWEAMGGPPPDPDTPTQPPPPPGNQNQKKANKIQNGAKSKSNSI